jgi:hypothetical protein
MDQPNPWKTPIIAAAIISLAGAGLISFLRATHEEMPVATPVVQAEAPAPVVEEQAPPPPAPEAPQEAPKPEPTPAIPKPETKAEATPPPPPAEEAKPVEKAAPATGPATLTGKVVLKSAPPKRKTIRMDADPKCAAMHSDEPALTEDVVTGADGALENVFVYVKTGLEGKTFPPPKTPVLIEQHGCHYVPHVLGMQAKQPLVIRNDDDTLHNVHALPTKSKEFNVGQPNKGMETTRTIPIPEVMVKFKCDVHPWMSAYIGVLDHPFFAVTNDKGEFTIKGLPPGEYTIEAWQETFGTQSQAVSVKAGESKALTFAFGN